MKIWLPPYLSVRRSAGELRLGTMPPLAYQVEEPPAFLADLLVGLADPAERDDVVTAVIQGSGWSLEEADALISDLEQVGALVPVFERGDRYDRHRLYFRMLGVDDDAQERLRSATVGLIGMGGIGTHLALHLAAAGIGRLIVTDGDVIETSNLTRQTLYREADVGRLKVEAAAERLLELRSDLRVDVIAERFDTPSLAETVANDGADIILLSADRPATVHRWVNAACLASNIPFSAAGYIEAHGCVGPLLHPPATACYECVRVSADALPDQPLDRESVDSAAIELNPGFQAPSYGPLNGLVAAVQANEAIRWLLDLPVATSERRLLIDSSTYQVTWEDLSTAESICETCGRGSRGTDWELIARQYQEEREHHSFNAVLLDRLVPTLLPPLHGKRAADVGAGGGQMTARLLELGAAVDAYEPSEAMRALLAERMRNAASDRLRIHDLGLEALAEQPAAYDAILCLNVLDHFQDLPAAMGMLATALQPGGRLVLSIPHPIKDRGGWVKTPSRQGWIYDHFVLDDYFREGPVRKVREDRWGDVRVRDVRSYHRAISTYMQSILSAGLTINQILEPAPDPDVADTDPIIHTKASRLPYFLVIAATRR